MAQAVKRLFPEAKLAIGPAISEGFYYDFEVGVPFSPDDLDRIEEEMMKIRKENIPLEKFCLSRAETEKKFHEEGKDELAILSIGYADGLVDALRIAKGIEPDL